MSIGDTIVISDCSITGVKTKNGVTSLSFDYNSETQDSRVLGELSKLSKKKIFSTFTIEVNPPNVDSRPGVDDPGQLDLNDADKF